MYMSYSKWHLAGSWALRAGSRSRVALVHVRLLVGDVGFTLLSWLLQRIDE